MSDVALRLLQAYRWPGNVRELLAVLESAHIRAGERRIEAQHLPADVRGVDGAGTDAGMIGERYRREIPEEDERAAKSARTAMLFSLSYGTLPVSLSNRMMPSE